MEMISQVFITLFCVMCFGLGVPLMSLLLLPFRLFEMGLNNTPTVTLAVLGLNVYLYLIPAAPPGQACISVKQTYWSNDWSRLLLSPLHHMDDWHITLNMGSFFVMGIVLERQFGRAWFLYLLSIFSLLTGFVYLALEVLLTLLTQDPSYSTECAVGFSGVLFALNVLMSHYQPDGVTVVGGIPVSNRYAYWVGPVLIYLKVPGSSLIGHLAGILVGLLYTAGPLKTIMEKFEFMCKCVCMLLIGVFLLTKLM